MSFFCYMSNRFLFLISPTFVYIYTRISLSSFLPHIVYFTNGKRNIIFVASIRISSSSYYAIYFEILYFLGFHIVIDDISPFSLLLSFYCYYNCYFLCFAAAAEKKQQGSFLIRFVCFVFSVISVTRHTNTKYTHADEFQTTVQYFVANSLIKKKANVKTRFSFIIMYLRFIKIIYYYLTLLIII